MKKMQEKGVVRQKDSENKEQWKAEKTKEEMGRKEEI